MLRNDDYAKGNLLHYFQKYYKHIGIDFVGRIEKGNGAKMIFIAEKQQKHILNFSLDSLNVTE